MNRHRELAQMMRATAPPSGWQPPSDWVYNVHPDPDTGSGIMLGTRQGDPSLDRDLTLGANVGSLGDAVQFFGPTDTAAGHSVDVAAYLGGTILYDWGSSDYSLIFSGRIDALLSYYQCIWMRRKRSVDSGLDHYFIYWGLDITPTGEVRVEFMNSAVFVTTSIVINPGEDFRLSMSLDRVNDIITLVYTDRFGSTTETKNGVMGSTVVGGSEETAYPAAGGWYDEEAASSVLKPMTGYIYSILTYDRALEDIEM